MILVLESKYGTNLVFKIGNSKMAFLFYILTFITLVFTPNFGFAYDTSKVIKAIVSVESKGEVGAYNAVSRDYGLMQINIYHVNKMQLDPMRLLFDKEYNVKTGTKIFNWFLGRYSTNEAIMRYNCGTKKSCVHTKTAKKYLKKVQKELQNIEKSDNIIKRFYAFE